MKVPKAVERIKIGLTSSSTNNINNKSIKDNNNNNNNNNSQIMIISENFITLFDAIKLNMLSKDTLHPILVEIIQAVNKVTNIDFEMKGKIIQWLITLNQMRAAEELSLEQGRELQFDMNQAYDGFKSIIG